MSTKARILAVCAAVMLALPALGACGSSGQDTYHDAYRSTHVDTYHDA